MHDHYSNDPETAAALARMDGDADHYENPDTEDVFPTGTTPVSRNRLVADVESALMWSGVLSARWRAGVEQTAPGVVAFPLADTDDTDAVTAVLTREGYETITRDGLLYVRQAQEATP